MHAVLRGLRRRARGKNVDMRVLVFGSGGCQPPNELDVCSTLAVCTPECVPQLCGVPRVRAQPAPMHGRRVGSECAPTHLFSDPRAY